MESCGSDRQKARHLIDKVLATVDWLGAGKGRAFYPVGGTWRNLARLHIEQYRYPLHAIHGHTISRTEAMTLARLVSRLGKSSLDGIQHVPRRRRETLQERQGVVEGTRGSERGDLGGRRSLNK